jgi:hypothetical protein
MLCASGVFIYYIFLLIHCPDRGEEDPTPSKIKAKQISGHLHSAIVFALEKGSLFGS